MSDQVEFCVAGRVQGVGFREFVRSSAMRIGVRGWVRNEPDGRVRGELEGSADDLQELRSALERGTPWSRVDVVEFRARDGSVEMPPSFEVRY